MPIDRKKKNYERIQAWFNPANEADQPYIEQIKHYFAESDDLTGKEIIKAGLDALEGRYGMDVPPRTSEEALLRQQSSMLQAILHKMNKLLQIDFSEIRAGNAEYIDRLEQDVAEETELHESITDRYKVMSFDDDED